MTDFIKFAFAAGEISPTLMGRTDLEKYDLGLALARNWFVDYRGGLSTRPGTVFCDLIREDDKPNRLVEFQYAPNVANTYALLFGNFYLRFIQDGAYVIQTGTAITGITQANPAVVTSVGHGLVTGDWVKLVGVGGMVEVAGRSFNVNVLTPDTYALREPGSIQNINSTGYTPYTSGGTSSRIYTINTPYAAADLEKLKFHQYRDLVRITHPNYPVYELVRVAHASWTLTQTVFGSSAGAVTGLTTTVSTTGNYSFNFVVTSVNAEGEESAGHTPVIEDNTANPFAGDVDYIDLSWNPVAGAKSYNVYSSRVQRSNDITLGAELGFIGRTFSTEFQHSNIIPDFVKTPPDAKNPFAPGAIEQINITAGGTGYTALPTITIGGGGTGWEGYPVVNAAGAVTAIITRKAGTGYTSPTVTISGGGGAGATATATAGPMTGTYPSLSCIFQQRQMYAASLEQPLTVWGSRPKAFDNFDVSAVVTDNDAYEFELDSEEVTPIKHLHAARGGLLCMTDAGIWLLSGGGLNDPVTPTNVIAQPNTFKGISEVPPIGIDTDFIYIESKGFTVRLLSYNDITKLYSGEDISIFSNHLFSSSNYITQWTYADDPHKLVWAVRQDGSLLSLTAVKEQKLFAWSQHWTKGLFNSVLTVREGNTDRTYAVVKRYVNGRWWQYLESFASRINPSVEDAFCLDAGLSLVHTYPAADANFVWSGADIIVTASAAVFTSGDVNKILRAAGGKFRVKTFTNTTTMTLTVLREPTAVVQEDPGERILTAASGTWTLDAPVTSIGGLWHLEGQVVNALVDGNVVMDLTVTAGRVILPFAGTMVHIGLPYTCRAKTLPLTSQQGVVEDNRKMVKGIVGRFNETVGLRFGTANGKVNYELPLRVNETPGEPITPFTGKKQISLPPNLDEDGEIYIEQIYPLPGTILGFVTDTVLGDEDET